MELAPNRSWLQRYLMCVGTVMLCRVVDVSSTSLVAPVYYDASSGTYRAKLGVGTPQQPELMTLDVQTSTPTLSCGSGGSFQPWRSSTYHVLPCSDHPALCGLSEDSLTLNYTDGTTPLGPATLPRVRVKCATSNVAAIGVGKLSLPTQLASKANITRTFAYCLPSSGASGPGVVFFGGSSTYVFQSGPAVNISGSLMSTALASRVSHGTHYYTISVKEIVVGSDETLGLRAPVLLHFSSTERYTRLQSSVYRKLRASFRRHVGYGTVNAAIPAPAGTTFDTCFNSTGFFSSRVGPPVAQIDLHLADGAVWSIVGFNSVVPVAENVLCLAFLDAGPKQPSILGTFQQYDNFLEFDLPNGILRYSGLLDFYRTLCSNFHF